MLVEVALVKKSVTRHSVVGHVVRYKMRSHEAVLRRNPSPLRFTRERSPGSFIILVTSYYSLLSLG